MAECMESRNVSFASRVRMRIGILYLSVCLSERERERERERESIKIIGMTKFYGHSFGCICII